MDIQSSGLGYKNVAKYRKQQGMQNANVTTPKGLLFKADKVKQKEEPVAVALANHIKKVMDNA